MAKSGVPESEIDPEDEITSASDEDSTDDKSVCVVRKPIRTSTPTSILIESLVKNICCIYDSNDANSLRNYEYICQKLYEMKLIDESYKMNEFEGMRNQYQVALHHLLTCAKEGEQSAPLAPFWPNGNVMNDWSHYYWEFDEIEFIAGGGYGKVYRVKHKLDSTEYAVKKIYIRSEGIASVRNYLSEVKTFASLNHPNIVQYKAAWLELGADTGKSIIMDHSSESDPSYVSSSILDEQEESSYKEASIFPSATRECEIDLTSNSTDSGDFEISFDDKYGGNVSYTNSVIKKENKGSRTKRCSVSEGGNAICTLDEIRNVQIQSRSHTRWATLYIQMTLCQSTLKQWLEKRNASEADESTLVSKKTNMRINTVVVILKQLLQGLEYIHSKHIVHHDIKPSNIFVQFDNESLSIQLGDFGLACPLQSARHSLALGTKLYAAPEQLNGRCDPKSDMYSLGIVLLELIEMFKTDMERVLSISSLRKGKISPHLLTLYPQLSNIMMQLVATNPADRPDSTELLKYLAVDVVESQLIQDLKCQLAQKDKEISQLKELLKSAGINMS